MVFPCISDALILKILLTNKEKRQNHNNLDTNFNLDIRTGPPAEMRVSYLWMCALVSSNPSSLPNARLRQQLGSVPILLAVCWPLEI